MKRGEIWFAEVGRGGDRPVLVLTRDPVADRIDAVVVAHLTTTIRGLTSELPLGIADGLKRDCVVSFDNLHTLPFRDRRFADASQCYAHHDSTRPATD